MSYKMTWLLINTELRYSSLNKIKEAATSRGAVITGEWTDEEIADAAQKIKDKRWIISVSEERSNWLDIKHITQEFLPDPIKEVL
jgi:hypothetical protein